MNLKDIEKYKYVSFDLFDTLIERMCAKPSDIFELVQETFNTRYNKKLSEFRRSRIDAELEARERNSSGEITLEQIYSCFDGLTKEELNILQQLEIELEIKLTRPRKHFMRLYNHLKDEGIHVFIVSDIYLPQNAIIKILDKCSINGYEKLGPLVYGYVEWLYRQLRNKDIHKIFFFSREGCYLKEIFDLYHLDEFKTEYLYVSRKALILPNLTYNGILDDVLTFSLLDISILLNGCLL